MHFSLKRCSSLFVAGKDINIEVLGLTGFASPQTSPRLQNRFDDSQSVSQSVQLLRHFPDISPLSRSDQLDSLKGEFKLPGGLVGLTSVPSQVTFVSSCRGEESVKW